ncbi:MAG: hypothetical protein COC06_11890 [Bacteroidales bacterium]|nr:MAG: hypothetical protein COC06_11890 [Bacteroidales bacterium]
MASIKKIRINSRNGDISALVSLILKAIAKNDWSFDIYLTPIIEKTSAVNTSLIEAIESLFSDGRERRCARYVNKSIV